MDLWEQTFKRLAEEEAQEIEKRKIRESMKKTLEKQELEQKERKRAWKPPPQPIYKPKPNYRQEGWFDCYTGQYID